MKKVVICVGILAIAIFGFLIGQFYGKMSTDDPLRDDWFKTPILTNLTYVYPPEADVFTVGFIVSGVYWYCDQSSYDEVIGYTWDCHKVSEEEYYKQWALEKEYYERG